MAPLGDTPKESRADAILVEARGHRCPTPILRLRRALERAPPGARVTLVADDPMARIDLPHFASEAGLEILALEEDGPAIIATVRKRAVDPQL